MGPIPPNLVPKHIFLWTALLFCQKKRNLFSIYVNSEKRREQEDYSIQPKKNTALVHLSKYLAAPQTVPTLVVRARSYGLTQELDGFC